MLRCFSVSVGAIHNDSTTSVVGLEGRRTGGGCHEVNVHSRDNGCVLSSRFCSCTDQGYGNDRSTVIPVQFSSSSVVSVRLWH